MTKVKVYYNLHKKCLSVMANEGEKKGVVIAHVNEIKLENVTFRVSQPGRERVLSQKRKNVHAFIYGEIPEFTDSLQEAVTYNPYKYDSFVRKQDETAIFKASKVSVSGRNIFI